jgi:hypothetical protein
MSSFIVEAQQTVTSKLLLVNVFASL